MYRIWVGLDPKLVMACLGGAIALMVLTIHIFAFDNLGYPASVKAKYPTYSPAPAAAPAR
ncbi:MAG: hypothetical protein MUF21_06470 [Gemmatimonadaceae bacterium]|jgi:hypothetical protein|nr:hypothetical protein [Gemmatimonadaceae bacterium]